MTVRDDLDRAVTGKTAEKSFQAINPAAPSYIGGRCAHCGNRIPGDGVKDKHGRWFCDETHKENYWCLMP